jgi:DNA polymerase-3 subunit epsilon
VISWGAALARVRALVGRLERRPSPFGQVDFVIVDLETTGMSPQEAAITEIGAVRVSGGQVCSQFSSLVHTSRAIPEPVAALTGISNTMLAAAPPLSRVLPVFLAFADGCVFAAHNAAFDVGFLEAACAACGLAWPGFPVLDTVDLAHRVLADGEVPDCKLSTLADYFGARTPPRHRALPDALATADVLAGLLGRLAGAGIRTLGEIGCG